MSTASDYYDLDGFGRCELGLDCSPPGMKLPPNPYYKFDVVDEFLSPRGRAPALLKLTLEPSSVEFLERLPNGLDEGAPSGVFRVNITNMGERVLKVFHGLEHNNRKGRSFVREAIAYRYLLREGVCAAGVVPYCYGYTVIDPTQWKMPSKDDWLQPFRSDPNQLKALVLEFLPCASKMTLRWTTPQTAQAAMDALNIIHRAGIVHSDIHPRNLLVLPEGRVVWIDFELAGTWPHNLYVTTETLHNELGLCWYWLYAQLLPWKWYALLRSYNQGELKDRTQLEAIEHLLVNLGCTICPDIHEVDDVRRSPVLLTT